MIEPPGIAVECKVQCVDGQLQISGEMTIYTCEAVASQVLSAITPDATPLRFALEQVTEMDTAGLQVILMARKHAKDLAREVSIESASPAVADVLGLCGLSDLVVSP